MSKQEAQTYKELGNAAFQQGNYQESVEHFTKAIECNPSDHVFYSNRSGAYASLNQYKEALEDANQCIKINPNWSKGYVRKGLAQFYLQTYDEAIATYNEGLQLDPNNQQLKDGLQRAVEEKNNSSKPKVDMQQQQLLMKLLSNPTTAQYLQDPQFVQNLMAIQKNPGLISAFASDPKMQQAFKVMFGLPDNFNYEQEAEKHSKNYEQAQQTQQNHEQKQTHEEHQEKPQTQQQQYYQQPQKPQQQQQTKQLSEAEVLKNQGNEYYKQRQFDQALSYYDQAIEKKPDEILFYNNKAACFIEMNRLDDALAICNQAIKIVEDNNINDFVVKAKIFARKGAVLAKLKNYGEAIAFYEKSLIENNDQKVRDEVNKLKKQKKIQDELDYINPELAEKENEVAKEFFQKGDWAGAIKHYDESIKRNPKEPKYLINKATCLMKLMEFAGANSLIEKALTLDPNNIKALLKKANCHFGLKEYDKALNQFQNVLKLEPENQEASEGYMRAQKKIMGHNETKEESEERARHAMADPEIQALLRDPEVMTILKNLQENPRDPNTLKALQNPVIAGKINKLIASGILKTA